MSRAEALRTEGEAVDRSPWRHGPWANIIGVFCARVQDSHEDTETRREGELRSAK